MQNFMKNYETLLKSRLEFSIFGILGNFSDYYSLILVVKFEFENGERDALTTLILFISII